MGLLSKIEQSVNKPYFSAFCEKYGFIHAGIYTLKNNTFFLQKSYGLDAETIFKSVSTKDFWEGTLNYKIDNDFWISFSLKEDNLKPFYQFFSKEIINSLYSIYYYIFKTSSETSIFFFINYEEEYHLPELAENFFHELLGFVNHKTFFINKKIDLEKYSSEKYIPMIIDFHDLYSYYLDEVKYYPDYIKIKLMDSFYEQFYLHIKNLLPETSVTIPYSNSKIHVFFPKTGLLEKINSISDINNTLKMYCSKNISTAVKINFYSFDTIDKDDFIRSKL